MGLFYKILSIGLVTATISGCASTISLKKRAAFDLGCSQDKLMITKLGDVTYGVTGCGKQATYIASGYGYDTWIANSPAISPSKE